MSLFSGKKLFLIGFIVVLLVAIPLTVYLAQQQQKTKSSAAKTTVLSLVDPANPTSSNIAVSVDQTFDIDVMVEPGENFVSYVKFTLSYDPLKIATAGAGIVPNSDAVTVFSGPTYGPSQVSFELATGGDQTKVIQTKTKIATITFKAISPTETAETIVGFGNDTEVLSTAPSDTSRENVLLNRNNAQITISTSSATTTTTIPTTSTTTAPSTTTSTTVSTTTTTVPSATNQSPICTSLVLSGQANGTAPYALNFTANGNDPDGTVSKVTFNFGDGTVNDITSGGNIGTQTVSVPVSHTFSGAGTFTTTAILADNLGGTSDTTNCSQTITIAAAATSGSGQPTTAPTATPIPPITPTGPGDIIMGIGAFGAILTIIGAVLLFAL